MPKEGGLSVGAEPHAALGVAESVKVSVPPVRMAEAGSHGRFQPVVAAGCEDVAAHVGAAGEGRVMPETRRARM